MAQHHVGFFNKLEHLLKKNSSTVTLTWFHEEVRRPLLQLIQVLQNVRSKTPHNKQILDKLLTLENTLTEIAESQSSPSESKPPSGGNRR